MGVLWCMHVKRPLNENCGWVEVCLVGRSKPLPVQMIVPLVRPAVPHGQGLVLHHKHTIRSCFGHDTSTEIPLSAAFSSKQVQCHTTAVDVSQGQSMSVPPTLSRCGRSGVLEISSTYCGMQSLLLTTQSRRGLAM